MAIEKVGVAGCGLMGSGIAQVAAQGGCTVVVREVSQPIVEKGLQSIEKNMQRMVDKGTLTSEARDQARGRLRGTTSLEELKDCDLIIEAIVEQLPAKKELWTALDSMCSGVHDILQQHVFAFDHRDGYVHQASRSLSGAALFQSGAGDEAGGSDPHHRDGRQGVRGEWWRTR
jgi:folate-dependent tRNA-U54 methylase TrmFO/GidA